MSNKERKNIHAPEHAEEKLELMTDTQMRALIWGVVIGLAIMGWGGHALGIF